MWYERCREILQTPRSLKRRRLAKAVNSARGLNMSAQGFCTVEPDALGQIPEVIERSGTCSRTMDVSAAKETSTKQHLLYPPLPAEEHNLASPFFKLALDETLIGAISRYLGCVPVLFRVSFMYSRYVPGARFESSQLYHCDWDAVSQVKVFLHISDVDERSGPLVLVDAEESARLRYKLRYVYRSVGSRGTEYGGPRLSDEEVEADTDKRFIHSITGGPGTLVLADTSRCLHYGSRLREGQPPRIILILWYLKPSAFRFPLWSRKGFPYRNMAGDATELQGLVLGRK